MNDNHGVSTKNLAIIKQVLYPYADKIQQVCLFGSRAACNYKPYSDIDLVIYGTLNETEENTLRTVFKDSLLPVSVDICTYHLITHEPLKQHIDKVATLLFRQQDL